MKYQVKLKNSYQTSPVFEVEAPRFCNWEVLLEACAKQITGFQNNREYFETVKHENPPATMYDIKNTVPIIGMTVITVRGDIGHLLRNK